MTNPDEVSLVEKASFAWTAAEGYKHFPVFVNLTGNRLAVRGREIFNGKHYEQGLYLAVELPDDAINELREALAATPLVKMREALEEWRNRCEYLLACIDQSNEAGAPVDESDPEDIAAIDEIRAAL